VDGKDRAAYYDSLSWDDAEEKAKETNRIFDIRSERYYMDDHTIGWRYDD
jgi:hypothetical protein